MAGFAFLIFGEMPDGSPLAVGGEHVLQYLDVHPPSFVPQPGARRGVMGVAALSWSGFDHAPVAVIDVLFALDLTSRPSGPSGLLLVRGMEGTVAGLLTALPAGPPRYESIQCEEPPTIWEPHPHIGNVLRRCPVAVENPPRHAWLLDPALFYTRLCHA